MRSFTLSSQKLLLLAAGLIAMATLLQVGVGCAGNPSARENTALHAYVQGVLAYQKGDNNTAMASFQDAVNKDSNLVMARSMLGDLYRANSDYEAAREQYEVLTRLDPYDYVNYFNLGVSYQFLQRLKDAARNYLHALELKPDHAKSNAYLGTVYLGLGQRDEAIKCLQRAVDLDPSSAEAFTNLGIALDEAGEYPRAETAFRKSLDLHSDQPAVQLLLAENLLKQRKFSEARSVLGEMLKNHDTALHRTRFGDAYLGEKNFPEAITQYQTALKLDPDYYQAYSGLGLACIGDYEKGLTLDDTRRKAALEAWQRSLSLKPNQPRILELVQKYNKAPMFQQ